VLSRAVQVVWSAVAIPFPPPPPNPITPPTRRLYELVRAEAVKAGAAGVRLYADDSNKRAHEAYTRLGMSSHYSVFEDMFCGY